MPPGQGRFSRTELKRYPVDRLRLRKCGPDLMVDPRTGKLYPRGLPVFRVWDNTTWLTVTVRAANAGHARRAALEEPETWGGWGD